MSRLWEEKRIKQGGEQEPPYVARAQMVRHVGEFPQAVQLFLNDQLVVKDRKVMFRPGRFPPTPGAA